MLNKLVKLASATAVLAVPAIASAQSNTITPGTYLFPGNMLVAPSCLYALEMQTDGNLVMYGNASTSRTANWASNTMNRGGYATLQPDGNFVIYNWSDSPVWATNTNNNECHELVQQDDGNLVMYNGSHVARWASNTAGESIGTTTCEVQSVVTNVYTGWDSPGNDYNHFTIPVARPSWCGYYCAQDSNCVAYTYVPPGVQGSQAVCWLKNATNWQQNSTMTSGVKYVP